MFNELLNKENYLFEYKKLFEKIKKNKKLANKAYLNKEITLLWAINNKSFIIKELIKSLKKNTYQTPQAIEYQINIKNKNRLIYAFDWHEKILHSVVAKVLNKYFEKYYSESLKSYRKGSGVHSTLKDLLVFLKQNENRNFYVLKLDIKAYGDSVDHEQLFNILKKYSLEEKFINLLYKILKFKYLKNNIMHYKAYGLPTGSALNNILCNIFLLDLDFYIFNNIKNSKYYRYGDDILFVSTDLEQYSFFKEKIYNNIAIKKLLLNPEKIIDTYCDKDYQLVLKYLGFYIDFKTKEILLTDEKDANIKNFIKFIFKRIILNIKNKKLTKKNKLKILINNYKILIFRSKLFSEIISYFNIVNSEIYWKQLDLYIATVVVSITYNIPRRKVFKKISYKTLRNFGLISLTHIRRKYLYKKSK